MENLNPNINTDPNTSSIADTRYQVPDVSHEQLAKMTGNKLEVQIVLAERSLGHFPKDDEFILWADLYAEKVNDYFFNHPYATTADLDEIEEFINEGVAVH